jgi:hypothetical protein
VIGGRDGNDLAVTVAISWLLFGVLLVVLAYFLLRGRR